MIVSSSIELLCSALLLIVLTSFRKQDFLKVLPQDTKQDTLQAIGENLGFESTKKEPVVATFLDDHADNLRVRELVRVRLFVHFHDANRVGAGIGNGRRGET
jgi:hypothetical protein